VVDDPTNSGPAAPGTPPGPAAAGEWAPMPAPAAASDPPPAPAPLRRSLRVRILWAIPLAVWVVGNLITGVGMTYDAIAHWNDDTPVTVWENPTDPGEVDTEPREFFSILELGFGLFSLALAAPVIASVVLLFTRRLHRGWWIAAATIAGLAWAVPVVLLGLAAAMGEGSDAIFVAGLAVAGTPYALAVVVALLDLRAGPAPTAALAAMPLIPLAGVVLVIAGSNESDASWAAAASLLMFVPYTFLIAGALVDARRRPAAT
jgi:hypothetical protein